MNSTITNVPVSSYSYIDTTSSFDISATSIDYASFNWGTNSVNLVDERLRAIEARLCILVPDPKKLEKYTALKQAYDHYILMEQLIGKD